MPRCALINDLARSGEAAVFRTFTWAPQVPLGSNQPKVLDNPTVALGSNAQTIAPVRVGEHLIVYLLSGNVGPSGHDFQLWQYTDQTSEWTALTDVAGNPTYLTGVTANYLDGAFWGWTSDHILFDNEGAGIVEGTGVVLESGVGFRGAAAGWITSSGFPTVVGPGNGVCSGPPAGDCLESLVYGTGSESTPPGGGALQVTLDPNNTLYSLDNAGHIWVYQSPNWVPITMLNCSGGNATFAQIAAKNGVVFGLNSRGTVFSNIGANQCWGEVGDKRDFAVSIATGNDLETSGVWATDGQGTIWVAR